MWELPSNMSSSSSVRDIQEQFSFSPTFDEHHQENFSLLFPEDAFPAIGNETMVDPPNHRHESSNGAGDSESMESKRVVLGDATNTVRLKSNHQPRNPTRRVRRSQFN
mmetsp:Transcript_3178/g.5994  ORF Transcript_3178/g.5994 Transcript_3178/m.5994 type:complete len:108 (-) Transcript_3178:235-558(-)